MRKAHRGFIPLVAIILLGLMAIAGGTIAAVSIRHDRGVGTPAATSTQQTGTSSTYSAPVQARIDSSGAGTPQPTPERHMTPVAQISATLDADTQAICKQPGTNQSLQALCAKLSQPGPNTPEQTEAWKNIEGRVKSMWKVTQQQQNLDNTLQNVPVIDHSMGTATTYDAAQCTAQKKGLVAQADQTYLTWYGQWQDARRITDSCYSSNSVPVCDKQLSEINVDWQNKLTVQFDTLHDQLTSCAPDARYFNDISSVIAAPY